MLQNDYSVSSSSPGTVGILHYLAHTGMCRWPGYGVWSLCPKHGV